MTVLSTASRPVDGTGQAPLYILPAGYLAHGRAPQTRRSGAVASPLSVARSGTPWCQRASPADRRLGRGVELPGGRPCSRELPAIDRHIEDAVAARRRRGYGSVRLTALSPVLRYLRDGRCRSFVRSARARSPIPNGRESQLQTH